MKKSWPLLIALFISTQPLVSAQLATNQPIQHPLDLQIELWSASQPLNINVLGLTLQLDYPLEKIQWLEYARGILPAALQAQLAQQVATLYAQQLEEQLLVFDSQEGIFFVFDAAENDFLEIRLEAMEAIQATAFNHIFDASGSHALTQLAIAYFTNELTPAMHEAYYQRLTRQRAIILNQLAPEVSVAAVVLFSLEKLAQGHTQEELLSLIVVLDALLSLSLDTQSILSPHQPWNNVLEHVMQGYERYSMAINALAKGIEHLDFYTRNNGQSFAELEGDSLVILLSLLQESAVIYQQGGADAVLDFIHFTALQGDNDELNAKTFATNLFNDCLQVLIDLDPHARLQERMNILIATPEKNAFYQDLLFLMDYLQLLTPKEEGGLHWYTILLQHIEDIEQSSSMTFYHQLTFFWELLDFFRHRVGEMLTPLLPEGVDFEQFTNLDIDEILKIFNIKIDILDMVVIAIDYLNAVDLWVSTPIDVTARYELYLAQLLGMRGLALSSVELIIETQAGLADARVLEISWNK